MAAEAHSVKLQVKQPGVLYACGGVRRSSRGGAPRDQGGAVGAVRQTSVAECVEGTVQTYLLGALFCLGWQAEIYCCHAIWG